MPRGRHYYDPIVQTGAVVEGENDLSRIEFYLDDDQKWKGRRVASDGSVVEVDDGDVDQAGALARAQNRWPGLTVYELLGPREDSTWEGHGPSPRAWQPTNVLTPVPLEEPMEVHETPPQEVVAARDAQAPINGLRVSDPGLYLRVEDVVLVLEEWSQQYDLDRNPSGALALREAAQAFRETANG